MLFCAAIFTIFDTVFYAAYLSHSIPFKQLFLRYIVLLIIPHCILFIELFTQYQNPHFTCTYNEIHNYEKSDYEILLILIVKHEKRHPPSSIPLTIALLDKKKRELQLRPNN